MPIQSLYKRFANSAPVRATIKRLLWQADNDHIDDLHEIFNSRQRVLMPRSRSHADSDVALMAQFRNGRRWSKEDSYPPSRYFRQNLIAMGVLRTEARRANTKFDLCDFENITQAIEATRKVPGAYVEIGVYQGDSARVALSYLKQAKIRRQAFLLDTFAGFNYPEAAASEDTGWAGLLSDTSPSLVRFNLSEFSGYNLIQSNIIADPLPGSIGAIAVANIDVDLKEAVAAALSKCAPLMSPGGFMICEDYGHVPALLGAAVAVNEFIESTEGQNFTPVYMRSGQMFLIRKGVLI